MVGIKTQINLWAIILLTTVKITQIVDDVLRHHLQHQSHPNHNYDGRAKYHHQFSISYTHIG